jgi:hypothetical protein
MFFAVKNFLLFKASVLGKDSKFSFRFFLTFFHKAIKEFHLEFISLSLFRYSFQAS